MKLICIVTDIMPSNYNQNTPGFLINKIMDEIVNLGYEVDVKILRKPNISTLSKLGFHQRQNLDFSKYHKIIFYPFHLFSLIDESIANRSIIVGPDSPSLLFQRITSICSKRLKPRYFVLWHLFRIYESRLNKASLFLCVGQEDLKKFTRINGLTHGVYLPHPIRAPEIVKPSFSSMKCLVITGDHSKKYANESVYKFINFLRTNEEKFEIRVVGPNNKWIHDEISKCYSSNLLSYQEWVSDYSQVCRVGIDIHLALLDAGAGTKNRVLDAIAFGIPVIGTTTAYENIFEHPSDMTSLGCFSLDMLQASLTAAVEYRPNLEVITEWISDRNKRFSSVINNVLNAGD